MQAQPQVFSDLALSIGNPFAVIGRGGGTGEAEPQAARAVAHYYSGPHDRGTMAP